MKFITNQCAVIPLIFFNISTACGIGQRDLRTSPVFFTSCVDGSQVKLLGRQSGIPLSQFSDESSVACCQKKKRRQVFFKNLRVMGQSFLGLQRATRFKRDASAPYQLRSFLIKVKSLIMFQKRRIENEFWTVNASS